MSDNRQRTKNEEALLGAVRLVLINLNLRKKRDRSCMLALDDEELAVHMEMVLERVGEEI